MATSTFLCAALTLTLTPTPGSVGLASLIERKRLLQGEWDPNAEIAPLIFRIRSVQTDGKAVQARVTNNEAQDRKTASYAYELLERLASQAAKNTAPSENIAHREFIRRARQQQRRPNLVA